MSFLINYTVFRGMRFHIPDGTDFENAFELKVAKIPAFETKKYVREYGLEYNESLLLEEPDSEFSGYFQSEKYLPFSRKTVKDYFQFKPHVLESAEKWMNEHSLKALDFTGVHIRRGDYTTSNGFYAYPSIEYYSNATKSLNPKKVVIFTDGLLTPDEIESFEGLDYTVCKEPAIESLAILSLSGSTVISASTFGWWGSYLSQSSINICPQNWYGPNGPDDRDHIFSSHLTKWTAP